MKILKLPLENEKLGILLFRRELFGDKRGEELSIHRGSMYIPQNLCEYNSC